MKRLFEIAVGVENGEYFAIVSSLTDRKHATVSAGSIKHLMPKIEKLVRVKARQERLIPLPARTTVRGRNGHEEVLAPDRN